MGQKFKKNVQSVPEQLSVEGAEGGSSKETIEITFNANHSAHNMQGRSQTDDDNDDPLVLQVSSL